MKKIKYPELLAEIARRGDTQDTLASLIGVPRGSISRRLSGLIEWKISEIEKICEHYGKDYSELFKKND